MEDKGGSTLTAEEQRKNATAAEGLGDRLTRTGERKMNATVQAGLLGTGQLSGEERKKSMASSDADGMGYAAMTGLGDAYLPAAAIALGAGNFYIGLLAALPQLLGAMLQFVSLSLLRIVKNRKVLVLAGSFLNALAWLPIIALVLWPTPLSIPLIILFFSLGAGITLMVNPAWSSWISDIVPENERAGFFARRNRLMQLTLFVTTFGAGFLITQLQLPFGANLAFAFVFFLAFLSRLSTVYSHLRTEDVKYEMKLVGEIQLKHLFLLPAHRNELWFLAFIALTNFTVQFAAPFFTPYLLSQLGYSVEFLGILTAVSILAKVVSYPYWGKAIDRFGNRAVLVTTAFLIPVVPFLWLFSTDKAVLCLFNVLSGFAWSGFDLASFNYALSLVGRELRPSFISKYNAFGSLFTAAGAIAGGVFLAFFPGFALFGYSGFLLVFMLSAAARFAVVLLFSPKLATGREVENLSSDRAMAFKLVAVYPTQGAVHHAVNGWNFTRKAVTTTAVRGERILEAGLGATGELLKKGGRKIMSKVGRKKRL